MLGRPEEWDRPNRSGHFGGPGGCLGCWRFLARQDFSIVDRTSFAVMRRLGIDRVASLDEHFAVFRFGPKRRQSFTIVR